MVDHVICFSLFGSDPKYRRGMMHNVHALDRVYPGWGLVIYCDRINHEALMQESLGDKVDLVLQQEHSQSLEGISWRLLATLQPGVRALLFRDSDSLFTTREADAGRQSHSFAASGLVGARASAHAPSHRVWR